MQPDKLFGDPFHLRQKARSQFETAGRSEVHATSPRSSQSSELAKTSFAWPTVGIEQLTSLSNESLGRKFALFLERLDGHQLTSHR